MTEKTYSHKEMADMFGFGLQEFNELMFKMGLLDKEGRPTKAALENGLLVERIIPINEG